MMDKKNIKNKRKLLANVLLAMFIIGTILTGVIIVSADYLPWWGDYIKKPDYPPAQAHENASKFIANNNEGDNYFNISGDMKINGTLFAERICFSGDCKTDLPSITLLTNICPDGMSAYFDVNGDLTKCIE